MEQTVHMRITDAASGKLLPCRLHISDNAGQQRVPLGYLPDPATELGREVGGHFVSNGDVWVYTDGSCEVRLPPGRVRVKAWHGPLYGLGVYETDRGQGRIAIRVQLQQTIFPGGGWHFADCRAHFLSPSAAALEGAAEGLQLVHLLAARRDEPQVPRLANLFDFSGQEVLLERYGCAVCVNTYHLGGPWGDLALVYCHRIVFPLTAGEPGFERYTLADWCYQCHRKGGLVIWPAFAGCLGERFPLALLGDLDAVEWSATSPWDEETLQLWYALLNAKRRLPVVGASARASNTLPLGAVRTATWLHAAQGFSLAKWVQAVKQGHTYATRGPILEWRVNDSPGVWQLTSAASRNREGSACADVASDEWWITATARSLTPFSRLELICGGEVLANTTATIASSDEAPSTTGPCQPADASSRNTTVPAACPGLLYRAELRYRVAAMRLAELPGPWLALRCWDDSGLAAHTSPIWLPLPPRLPAQDRQRLLNALAASESVLTTTPHPRQDALWERLNRARATLA